MLADRRGQAFGQRRRKRLAGRQLGLERQAVVRPGPLERDPQDHNTAVNPIVIVEVLSDSTEAYDRGQKREHYQTIPTLADYVLVSQREPRIEVYHLKTAGAGVRVARPGDTVELPSINCELAVDEVYRDVF